MSNPNLNVDAKKAGNIIDRLLKPTLTLKFPRWVWLAIVGGANAIGVIFHV